MKQIKKGGLRRRFAIGAAGARSGLGLLSSRTTSLLLPKDKKQAHNERALEREALRFVKELGELKGAYVKIGQMLALYGEHILPKPVTNALHTLEAQTTPLEWSAISQQLGDEFVNIEIEEAAFAAASLAQVHKASSTTQGRPLCLKVQYPGVADAIEDDFRNVIQMLTLTRWVKSSRQLEGLTKELKKFLLTEVDYAYELNTAQQVAKLLKGDDRFMVPRYYPDLCTSSVLTMDYVNGVDVMHTSVQGLNQERRNNLALAMLDLFFKEAFEWGLMQTDPNFGNYRILIDEDGEQDRIALLDFGAVHPLPPSFTHSLKTTILASYLGDSEAAVAGLIGLHCLKESDSDAVKESFVKFCAYIIEPFAKDSADWPKKAIIDGHLYDWRASGLLKRAGKYGSKQMMVKGFVIPPPEFMLIARKLTGVFTFVSALGAKINSSELLDRYID